MIITFDSLKGLGQASSIAFRMRFMDIIFAGNADRLEDELKEIKEEDAERNKMTTEVE